MLAQSRASWYGIYQLIGWCISVSRMHRTVFDCSQEFRVRSLVRLDCSTSQINRILLWRSWPWLEEQDNINMTIYRPTKRGWQVSINILIVSIYESDLEDPQSWLLGMAQRLLLQTRRKGHGQRVLKTLEFIPIAIQPKREVGKKHPPSHLFVWMTRIGLSYNFMRSHSKPIQFPCHLALSLPYLP